MADAQRNKQRRPIGLLALLEEAGNPVPPPAVVSFAGGSTREERHAESRIELSIPNRGAPDSVHGHLEYALRREPLDLRVWHAITHHLGPDPFAEWIGRVPNGKHARRAWCLYELLTGERLPVPNATTTNFVPLADDDLQFTSSPRFSARHRVADNLLGSAAFCPLVRKTGRLRQQIGSDLGQRTRQVVSGVRPRDLMRATDYLYHKETKASFQIEREDVSLSRMERFVVALRNAASTRWYDESELTALQNEIVEPRYVEKGFRQEQIYVGRTLPWGGERVHYPCPKPEDVEGLMRGWRNTLERTVRIDPVCQAAILGFGFVFIHPFGDGNGRLHRFVIHATLARRGFTAKDVVIPVSAVILRQEERYDAALEAFSKPLLAHVRYTLDSESRMTVHGETAFLYRYWDATAQCEYLYDALSEAVDVDLPDELRMLRAYDAGRVALLDVVDMPDRKADLLMSLLLQNAYRLSKKKRHLFAELTDDEIAQIEEAVRGAAEGGDSEQPNLPLG